LPHHLLLLLLPQKHRHQCRMLHTQLVRSQRETLLNSNHRLPGSRSIFATPAWQPCTSSPRFQDHPFTISISSKCISTCTSPHADVSTTLKMDGMLPRHTSFLRRTIFPDPASQPGTSSGRFWHHRFAINSSSKCTSHQLSVSTTLTMDCILA